MGTAEVPGREEGLSALLRQVLRDEGGCGADEGSVHPQSQPSCPTQIPENLPEPQLSCA